MESTKYLLIGGGPASVWAAQSIRQHDAEGRLILVGAESHPPYDKPPLSKQYLIKDGYAPDDAYSKFDNFYPDNKIELRTGVRATKLDPLARAVTLDTGETIQYEKLLLATGSRPRRLDLPGGALKGIHYLRTIEDAEAIRAAAASGKRAALVGAGFIGMEVAAACAEKGLAVTVIEALEHPWARYASPGTGKFLQSYFAGRGVEFLVGESVTGFSGDGALSAVQTHSGAIVAADFAVVGIGVDLNLDLAKGAGLKVDDKEGILVDPLLQTSDPHIWAAGDIACFEDRVLERRWHAEHHLNAKWQGRTVGATMAGEPKPYEEVAYFWSDMFDLHMILRGDPQADKATTVLGDREAAEFVELYPDASGRLRMGIAFSRDEPKLDPISDKLEALIRAKTPVAEIEAAAFGL